MAQIDLALPLVAEVCVEVVEVRMLRPNDALEALPRKRMHDAAVGPIIALDLTLHANDEAGVHPNVVVLGASDLVGKLQLRGGAMDVGLGEGDADAAASAAAAAACGGYPRGRRGGR